MSNRITYRNTQLFFPTLDDPSRFLWSLKTLLEYTQRLFSYYLVTVIYTPALHNWEEPWNISTRLFTVMLLNITCLRARFPLHSQTTHPLFNRHVHPNNNTNTPHRLETCPPRILWPFSLVSSPSFHLPSAINWVFHVHLWGVEAPIEVSCGRPVVIVGTC